MSTFPHVPANDWTPDRTERLRQMCLDGLSASQMAMDLGGVTRNAVIGKARRMGFGFSVNPGGRPRQGPKPRPRTHPFVDRKPPAVNSIVVDLPLDEPAANPVRLLDLEPHHCRWPVAGEPRDMLFCGAVAVDELPYCLGHARMAYQPARRTTEAERHLMLLRARRLNGLAKTFDKPLQSASD